MLRISTETKRTKTTLVIEGRMAGSSVGTVEQCWRELFAASPKQRFVVNLCGVSFIDSAGKILLREMHRLGAELHAEGCLNQAIVDEISASGESSDKSHKKSKGTPIIFYVAFLSVLLVPLVAAAQEAAAALPSKASTGTLAALYLFNQARADYARAIGQMEKTYSK
jgi:ABC-type transporter Mla MlaB component